MKILVKAPLSPYSGYGNDGIGIARALMRWGADVVLQPTVVQAPIPEDVAHLLTKELSAPFDLTIHHVDPMTLDASDELRRSSEVIIGWSMWESSNFKNMTPGSLRSMRKRLKNFDALVGYDAVSTEGFRPYFKGPLFTQQGGFWPEAWPEIERDWHEENFYFFMIGVLSQRKNPFAAIQAFSELKSEHADFDQFARLSLKTTAPGLHSRMEDVYPGLRVFYDMWPTEVVQKFYAVQHVLLAPSRGEGKNMPALEFMSTGGTVIATDWGGHTQWLNPEYSYPLDYTLQPVDEKHPDTLQADASVPHLKELMLHAFRNREEVRQKGAIAAQVIPAMCSWDAVIERFFLQLKDTIPGGDRLWTLAQMARQESSDGDR